MSATMSRRAALRLAGGCLVTVTGASLPLAQDTIIASGTLPGHGELVHA